VNKVSLHYKGQPFNVVKGSKCCFSVRTVANTQIYSGQNAQLLKAEGHCTYSNDYTFKGLKCTKRFSNVSIWVNSDASSDMIAR